MPYLQSSISPAIRLSIARDRTTTVRASVKDIERTLLISIVLVILVVFAVSAHGAVHDHPQYCRAAVPGGHLRWNVFTGL